MSRTFMPLLATAVAAAVLVPASVAQGACDDLGRADAVVCEINDLRAERGLEPLTPDRRLERGAETYARDMVGDGFFSHVGLDGATLAERLGRAGYITGDVAWQVGEVLAWGRGERSTPAATVAAWMRSRPHRRILLDARYRDVGVGMAPGVPAGGAGRTYATELGRLG